MKSHYCFILLGVLLLIMITITQSYYSNNIKNDSNQSLIFSKLHQNKYLWGTYKPNLYFSMKQKTNPTDVLGIMWYNPHSSSILPYGEIKKRMRHECKKADNVNYFWQFHNGIDYGSQIINDEQQNNLRLNTQWIKNDYDGDNQSWDILLHGEKINENHKKSKEIKDQEAIGLVLYFTLEDYDLKDKSFLKIEPRDNNGYEVKGMKRGNEDFVMNIQVNQKENANKSPLINNQYQKYRKAYNQTWRVKDFITNELSQNEQEYINSNKTYSFLNFGDLSLTQQPNVIAIQFILTKPFDIVINYSTITTKTLHHSINSLREKFQLKQKEFDIKFNTIFPIKQAESHLTQMTKEALSNVLGGIGYFYGAIESNQQTIKEEPQAIFTGTPCRSFFARGFLWDEGFHNIIISMWDIHLSIDILDSYWSTMSPDGWIPREQIRGEEAKSQVPPEFIRQNNKIANPPTLIFPINSFIIYYKYNSQTEKQINLEVFLKKSFEKMRKWFDWYQLTQMNSKRKKYQWHGRDSSHNFPSGFDDLPRGMTPNDEEHHLDLYIWIIELVKTLRNLSEIFQMELYEHYNTIQSQMINDLKNNFYDADLGILNDYLGPQFKRNKVPKFPRKVFPYLWRGDNQCGKDITNPLGTQAECDPYSNMMCCSEFGWCGNTANHCKCDKCKIYEKLEKRKDYAVKENTFNPHLGYVQLFPLFFGTYDKNDEAFEKLLDYLLDENELLSFGGIRSLSKSDLLYHTGEDYWRGHVWVNVNYMILKGLYQNYMIVPKAKKAYEIIRERLIMGIYTTWKSDHFFYEQYDDSTGKGRKNYPFNGWTALVLNIITEQYDK